MFVQKQCKRDLNGEFDEISAILIIVVVVVVVVLVVVVVVIVAGVSVVLIDRTNTFLSLLYRKRTKNVFVQKQCKRDLNGEFDEISAILIIVASSSSSSSSSSRSKCSTDRPSEHFFEPFVPETYKNVFVQKQCKRDLNGEFDEISAILIIVVVVVVVVLVVAVVVVAVYSFVQMRVLLRRDSCRADPAPFVVVSRLGSMLSRAEIVLSV